MTTFYLNLTSSEAVFDYEFSQDFIDKRYEIALVRINGQIFSTRNNNRDEFEQNIEDKILLTCNLIGSCYVNEKQINIIHMLDSSKNVYDEKNNLIYHQVINRPNTIILKLLDIHNNPLDHECNLFIELHMREVKV